MKYKVNDRVIIKWDNQLIDSQVIKTQKTWFGNRYLLFFTVNIIGSRGEKLYKENRIIKRFERQIIGTNSAQSVKEDV